MEPFSEGDLNKIAFWMATGSGKTLLMHCHIRQYRTTSEGRPAARTEPHHPADAERRSVAAAPGRVRAAGIEAELFRQGRSKSLFTGQRRRDHRHPQAARRHRREDRGHGRFRGEQSRARGRRPPRLERRGVDGQARRRLCENGFSFEYSATFGQAIKAASRQQSR